MSVPICSNRFMRPPEQIEETGNREREATDVKRLPFPVTRFPLPIVRLAQQPQLCKPNPHRLLGDPEFPRQIGDDGARGLSPLFAAQRTQDDWVLTLKG